MDGLECLDRIMVERPCPVVMISSLTTEGAETTLNALELGAVDFVPKPGGTVSLAIDELAPLIDRTVTVAATARVRRSHRLVERLRARRAGCPTSAAASRRQAARLTPAWGRRAALAGAHRHLDGRAGGAGGTLLATCRRPFPGRSWWPSTCRRPSPARWPRGWTGFARCPSSRSRGRP
jgi:two-component system chemotaxis response regulator CheB